MITLKEIQEICEANCTCSHPDFWAKCPACKTLDAIKKRIDENFSDEQGDRNAFWKAAGK